jgi:hypothetical protein
MAVISDVDAPESIELPEIETPDWSGDRY